MNKTISRIEQILGSNAQLVVVGGSIRDWLLGRNNEDWDLATALMPEEVIAKAQVAGVKAVPTGIQHGTVTLIVDGHSIEITTFRSDGTYLDGRHPKSVTLGVSLEQDLARRDFTINAMALPVSALSSINWLDSLIDPYGGRQDLENRIIRTVGDPLSRFKEDGLRVLRACRFSAILDFDIDKCTIKAIPMCLNIAKKLAVERVFTELTKLICAPKPERGLNILLSTGLLELLLPELYPMINFAQNNNSRCTVWEHTIAVVRRLPSSASFRWAALLHDVGKPANKIVDNITKNNYHKFNATSLKLASNVLTRMHASRAFINQVTSLIRHYYTNPLHSWNNSACRRFIKQLFEDNLTIDDWSLLQLADKTDDDVTDQFLVAHYAMVKRLKALISEQPPIFIKDLAIDGSTIMKIAKRQGGPWIKELQSFLLDTVLEDPNTNKFETLEPIVQKWLKSHYKF